jgi:hypothetical protein
MHRSFIKLVRLAGKQYRLHKDLYMAMSGSIPGAGSGGSGDIWSELLKAGQGQSQGFWGLLQGLFNNNKNPYSEGFNATKPYFNSAVGYQNPFVQQGQEANTKYNSWLDSMQDPSKFINNLMGGYQESPWAKVLQQNANRAGTNEASASGLTGSTPFAQQLQQNATQISSADMQNWLSNVLGINTQYGAGENSQVERGQHASDILSQLFSNQGDLAGGSAAAGANWNNQQENGIWSNISKIFGG